MGESVLSSFAKVKGWDNRRTRVFRPWFERSVIGPKNEV